MIGGPASVLASAMENAAALSRSSRGTRGTDAAKNLQLRGCVSEHTFDMIVL